MRQRLFATRQLYRDGVAWLFILVLLLAGCSSAGPTHFYTLPQLHIPHLQWRRALSRIPLADGTRGGIISGLTTFQRPGASTVQVVVNLINAADLQMLDLDSGGHHPLNMGEYCLGPSAVTSDGQWIACVSSPDGDNGHERLQVAALHAIGASQVHQLHPSLEPFYSNLAWSPDGQYLAVALRGVDGSPCSVAIYTSSPPYTTFTRAVNLTSVQFSTSDGLCNVADITWSAAGHQLWVLGLSNVAFAASVDLTPYLRFFASPPTGNVVSVEVPGDQVQTFPYPSTTNQYLQMLINPQNATVLYTALGTTEHLMAFNLHTKQRTDLFTLPTNYFIRALTWLPNGRQLLLAVGNNPCVDCNNYAVSDVYLYSLPASP